MTTTVAVNVTVVENTAAMNQLLHGPTGPVSRDLFRRAHNVRNVAVRLCPVDTGRLRASITADVVGRGSTLAGRVGTNVAYAPYVHGGTGIYGPSGQPIRPKTATYLTWTPRGGDAVYAPEVRGQRGVPFLDNALYAARD